MKHSHRIGSMGATLAFVLAIAGTSLGQPIPLPPPKSSPAGNSESRPGADTPNAKERKNGDRSSSFEALRLPAGAIVVLCDQLGEALRLVPQAVVLPAREYQKLREQLEQAQRQSSTPRPETPSVCRITGQVKDELVTLRLEYEFRTERPRTWINLGCQRGWPVDARLDGALPAIQAGDDGFIVQVDRPGIHHAVLELRLPHQPRRGSQGAERGFDLDLPRAAITTLEQLDFTIPVAEVRLGNHSVTPEAAAGTHGRLVKTPVAPLDRLELTWKGQAPATARAVPVLSATGHILVRVGETQIVTEAGLVLEVLQGETAEWRIQVPLPPKASLRVKLTPQDEARGVRTEQATAASGTQVSVHLKEASNKPFPLTLEIRQPRSPEPFSLGPITVLDALIQKGDLQLIAPDDARIRVDPHGEVTRRTVTEEMRRENVRAVFNYWNSSIRPQGAVQDWLRLAVEPMQGNVTVQAAHVLRLQEIPSKATWQLACRWDVTPLRTSVDHLELDVPPSLEVNSRTGVGPAELVESATLDAATGHLQVRLAGRQRRPFSLTISGAYPVPEGQQSLRLLLPRVSGWGVERFLPKDTNPSGVPAPMPVLERGGQIQIVLPENSELTGPPLEGQAVAAIPDALRSLFFPVRAKPGTREQSWQAETLPDHVSLAWRVRRAIQSVQAIADLQILARQVRVRERCHFILTEPFPSRLRFRLPPGSIHDVTLVEGGRLAPEEARDPNESVVVLAGPARREATVVFEYAIAPPVSAAANAAEPRGTSRSVSRHLSLPFIQFPEAEQLETRARVWCDPQEQPSLARGNWEELPTEIVADRDALPALVVRNRSATSLALTLSLAPSSPLTAVIVQRVLIQSWATEGGTQTYRVRYVVSKLNSSTLNLELPAPLPATGLEIRLDGRRLPAEMVDDEGRRVDLGRRLRAQVDPALLPRPAILEVTYQLDAARLEGNGWLRTRLQPPRLEGALLLGRTRWLVDLPAGWVAWPATNGATVEHRWTWWGWLLAPRPAYGRDQLERWLSGSASTAAEPDSDEDLLCWQNEPRTLPLWHVPQRLWLLLCSLTTLVAGLILLFVPLVRWAFWLILGSLVALVALAAMIWPAALPAILLGCEPGIVILGAAMLTQWLLHQRYRRQIVFMPGFSRVKQGSSLIRGGSSNRGREPSTIDQAPKAGSSLTSEPHPGVN